MKVYILCPDGSNRPEIYVPHEGYLYFGDPTRGGKLDFEPYDMLKFFKPDYVRRGNHPITNNPIATDKRYCLIDLPEDVPLDAIVQMVSERDLLVKKRKEAKEKRDGLYRVEGKITALERELDEPISILRAKTATVGKI